MSSSAPRRSIRFRQTPSPLRLESISADDEPVDDLDSVPGSQPTTSPNVDSDLGSRTRPTLRPSPHRTSKPLQSILKRKAQTEITKEEWEDDFHWDRDREATNLNRFEISVIRYQTSCCKALVSMEHISDWIHETPSNVHLCPSCMLPCILDTLRTPTPPKPQSQSQSQSLISLNPRYSRVLSLIRTFFQHQYARITPSAPSPTRRHQPDPIYRLFDTDDETYPETEFTRVLSSSLFTTDVKEASLRLLSIAGLTLVLLALLSQ